MSDSRAVLVVSRNYSTGLGVIRSLGAAGYTVDLISSSRRAGRAKIAACSRYVNSSEVVYAYDIVGESGDNLIEALLKYGKRQKEKTVLIPVDDFTASVSARNYDRLKEYFLVPDVTADSEFSLTDIMNKSVQSRFAEEVNLTVPREWVISLNEEIIVPEDMIYPCFVKILQSFSGHKEEMKVCENESGLREHLLRMKKSFPDRSALVQEFLDIDKEYALSGVCSEKKVIIPGVVEKMRTAGHERGVAMLGKMLPVSVLGDTAYKIENMLRRLHYTGMFDIDLFKCRGSIFFGEINLRPGGLNYSYYLNGVNLPAMLVKELTGDGHRESEEIIKEFGKTFVYEKVAWEDYINSYITYKDLKQCFKDADFKLIFDKNDPAPWRRFNTRIRLSLIKNRLKRLIGR